MLMWAVKIFIQKSLKNGATGKKALGAGKKRLGNTEINSIPSLNSKMNNIFVNVDIATMNTMSLHIHSQLSTYTFYIQND